MAALNGRRCTSSLLLIVIAANLWLASGQGITFDLNEEPELEEEERGGAQAPSTPAADEQRAETPQRPKLSVAEFKRLKAIYEKVLKLMEKLEICDNEQFDLGRVGVPETWPEHSKAMFVLQKIGRKKMIKKADMARYRRIMDNCKQIEELAQARELSQPARRNEMSGVTGSDTERLQLRYQQDVNPLDEIRLRFVGPARPVTGERVVSPPDSGVRAQQVANGRESLAYRPADPGVSLNLFL